MILAWKLRRAWHLRDPLGLSAFVAAPIRPPSRRRRTGERFCISGEAETTPGHCVPS
ncbi:MAG: hypothetical protein IPO37_00760 [Saprospiraceae bacterium]|nr:hypothetical protein [Saprospiraceae bacterium]